MSTGNSLHNLAPPVPVSKCQPRKMVKNVHLSHSCGCSTVHDIWQILLMCLQLLFIFYGHAALWNFVNTNWLVWGSSSLPLYSPQYLRDLIDILVSHYSEWKHELFWLRRLYVHFLGFFGTSIFCEDTLTDVWVKIRYYSTAHYISCIMFIFSIQILLIMVSLC